MKRYFIDSNIFLRLLSKEDEKTFKACNTFLKLVKYNEVKAACSDIVLAEVSWTLKTFYKFPKPEIITASRSIINFKSLLWTNKFDHRLALNLYQEHGVKFIDCLIASIPQIQSGEWTIVSYDKDFDKLKVSRIEPHQIKV